MFFLLNVLIYYERERIIKILLFFVFLRVFKPKAGFPHGVKGRARPIGHLPSPPPCG
jgi:hypothetical protein